MAIIIFGGHFCFKTQGTSSLVATQGRTAEQAEQQNRIFAAELKLLFFNFFLI